MNEKKFRYMLLIVVLGGFALKLIDLAEPWIGLKDFTGALHGQIAKNYVRFGYLGTSFGPVTNFEPHPESFTYYLHHPILFNIVVSLSVHLFGPWEWAMRLVPVLFSTAGIVLVFFLARLLWNSRVGLFAATFLAFVPMEGYFGRMVNEETLAAPLITALMIYYVKRMRGGGRRDLFAFYALLLVGLLTAWPVYYVAGFLLLHRLIYGRRTGGSVLRAAIPPALAVLMFGLFLLYSRYLTGNWSQNLLTVFLERTGAVSALMARGSYTQNVPGWFVYYFTPVTLFLSAIFFWKVLARRLDSPPASISIVLLLYLVGLTHILIFREGALRHEFWLYYFSVPVVISSAAGLDHVLTAARSTWVRRLMSITVFGIFIPLSVLRVISVHEIKKFEDIPALGRWLQQNTDDDAEILVIGPALSRFGYSEKHFDYYHGPIYTWPMPHVGYYSQRKIRWGIRDVHDLETLLEDPGKLEYAIMTFEYADTVVDQAWEYLSQHCTEIKSELWSKEAEVHTKLFRLQDYTIDQRP